MLKTSEHTATAALAVAVGLAAGFGAVGFRHLINFFQSLAYDNDGELPAPYCRHWLATSDPEAGYRFRFPEYLKAAVGGVASGALGLAFPQVPGVGYGAIDHSLALSCSWWLLLVPVAVKIMATPDVFTVSVDDNLYDALEKTTRRVFSILPAVSAPDPTRLVGVLSRRDIIGAYDKASIKTSLDR